MASCFVEEPPRAGFRWVGFTPAGEPFVERDFFGGAINVEALDGAHTQVALTGTPSFKELREPSRGRRCSDPRLANASFF